MAKEEKELNIEKLAEVYGGTAEEISELKEAILSNPYLVGYWDKYIADPRLGNREDMVCANIIVQFLGVENMDWSDFESNVYEDGIYSHDQIVNLLKNYRP